MQFVHFFVSSCVDYFCDYVLPPIAAFHVHAFLLLTFQGLCLELSALSRSFFPSVPKIASTSNCKCSEVYVAHRLVYARAPIVSSNVWKHYICCISKCTMQLCSRQLRKIASVVLLTFRAHVLLHVFDMHVSVLFCSCRVCLCFVRYECVSL